MIVGRVKERKRGDTIDVIIDMGMGLQIWGKVVKSKRGDDWFWSPPYDHIQCDEVYGPYPSLRVAVKCCIWSRLGKLGHPILKISRELSCAPEA